MTPSKAELRMLVNPEIHYAIDKFSIDAREKIALKRLLKKEIAVFTSTSEKPIAIIESNLEMNSFSGNTNLRGDGRQQESDYDINSEIGGKICSYLDSAGKDIRDFVGIEITVCVSLRSIMAANILESYVLGKARFIRMIDLITIQEMIGSVGVQNLARSEYEVAYSCSFVVNHLDRITLKKNVSLEDFADVR